MSEQVPQLANKCEDTVNLQGAEAYCVATRTACSNKNRQWSANTFKHKQLSKFLSFWAVWSFEQGYRGSLSFRFNGHFLQVNLGFIEAKDDDDGGDDWSFKDHRQRIPKKLL